MLIESIVRKTLGLKRHCVKNIKEKDGHLIVYLKPDKRFKLICSHCGSKGPGYDTLKERMWKHVPLWGIPVVLVCSVECGFGYLGKNGGLADRCSTLWFPLEYRAESR